MKKTIFFFIAFLTACLYQNMAFCSVEPISFRITKHTYLTSTHFEMADKMPMGHIEKPKIDWRSRYNVYDGYGQYEGRGNCVICCLGIVYIWGTEINIKDAQGNKIGYIDGQVGTTELAKFSIYNKDQRIAIAYMDKDAMGFTIYDEENPNLILAKLNRNFVENAIDNWDVNIYFPERIPPLFVKIFAAFACDRQGYFKPDN